MEKIGECLLHQRVTEIYCSACKSYLCIECLNAHDLSCDSTKYIHVFKHAEQFALPRFDKMTEELTSDKEINNEAENLVKELAAVVPDLKSVANEHIQSMNILKNLAKQLESMAAPTRVQPISEQMRAGLTNDKKSLENAIKSENLECVIKLTKKIIGEAEITRKENLEKEAFAQIKSAISSMSYTSKYKETIDNLQALAIRCQRLRLCGYITNWKIDRKYLSRKMTLSEDGLEYGNSASDGYPCIIGDTPIETGICIFEVIPTGLNCTAKEGFGIIEYNTYLDKVKADPVTPICNEQMMGVFYSNSIKRMDAKQSGTMQMGSAYRVRVDMGNLTCTIKGPNIEATGKLDANTVYVPCFSLGCSGNKLRIKIIDSESD